MCMGLISIMWIIHMIFYVKGKIYTAFSWNSTMAIGFITNGIRVGLQRSDLMESSTYRCVMNYVIWIQDIMITYWYESYIKNIVLMLRSSKCMNKCKNKCTKSEVCLKIESVICWFYYIFKWEKNHMTMLTSYMIGEPMKKHVYTMHNVE